jgi:hypothetical protein
MKNKQLATLGVLAIFLFIMPGCGSNVTSGDLPEYPGATQLKPGESAMGSTLAQNMKQDAAVRQAAGTGGKIEQMGFKLPAESTWEQVKTFYDQELRAKGWESGLGGVAGNFVDINAVMGAVNQGNDMAQTAIWSKGKQTLTVVMVISPADRKQRELILSLASR